MTEHDNKLFIHTRRGVQIIYNAGTKHTARRFISKNFFDYDKILGLDQPKKRLAARTRVWDSPQNCHVVHKLKIAI